MVIIGVSQYAVGAWWNGEIGVINVIKFLLAINCLLMIIALAANFVVFFGFVPQHGDFALLAMCLNGITFLFLLLFAAYVKWGNWR